MIETSAERLEHINNTFGKDKYLHVDISWLIKQAKKLETIKNFCIDCDGDERAIQRYEILNLLE